MISANLLMIVGIIVLGVISLIQLKKNFSERLFFSIGMFLFLIMGFSNSYGLYLEWSYLHIYIIISKLAGILFNFAIAYFFYYLRSKAPASMGGAGTTLSEKEIEAFMRDELPNEEEDKKENS